MTASGSRLTVLGQLIDLDAQENWRVGDTVAISGFRNAQDVWLAKRVIAAGTLPQILSGIVRHLDTTAKTFTIGALTVYYGAATPSNFSGDPQDGTNVRVSSTSLNSGGPLQAASVTNLDPALPGTKGDSAYIEGWVTAQVSPQDFDVNNHHVFTSASTTFEPSATGISTATFVQVSGLRRADGGVDAFIVNTCNMSPTSGTTATLMSNGKVLLLGGDPCGEFATIFDTANNAFSSASRTATSRFSPAVTLLADGRVLIAGGWGGQYTTFADGSTTGYATLTSTEIYDPTSGRFTAAGNMAVGHARGTATLLPDGRVLLAGGLTSWGGGGASGNSAEVFDPATGKFTTVGPMATQRTDHTANLLGDGTVLIAGGWNGHGADAAEDPPYDPLYAELFDPASGTFRLTGSMSTTRIGAKAITLSVDTVFLFGGVFTPLQNALAQPSNPAYAEMYHAAAHAFARSALQPLLQSGYTVTPLSSGQLLLLGGQVAGQSIDTADLLNPLTGVLVSTTKLKTPRSGHTATLLADGRVLLIGGVDAAGSAISTVEYWSPAQ